MHNLAVGQVAEFLVWTRLIAMSGGDIHVFLPLDDRGIDGICPSHLHRWLRTGSSEGRSVHPRGGIAIQVPAGELLDDRAVVVAVYVEMAAASISDHALVVDAPTFRESAAKRHSQRRGSVRG